MKLGVLTAKAVRVSKSSPYVEAAFDQLYAFVQEKFAREAPSSDATVSAVRRMYRRIGWEPTRYRPSSEAMLRRILKNLTVFSTWSIWAMWHRHASICLWACMI
jgi:DNA/RNA-binding domain of Phe-tRNA-synthetase-like protein